MVLAVLQLPGGQLRHHRLKGIAELTHQTHRLVLVQRQHRHAAGMLHHLTPRDVAVGQLRLVLPHPYDDALKQDVLFHSLFR